MNTTVERDVTRPGTRLTPLQRRNGGFLRPFVRAHPSVLCKEEVSDAMHDSGVGSIGGWYCGGRKGGHTVGPSMLVKHSDGSSGFGSQEAFQWASTRVAQADAEEPIERERE